MTPDTDLAALLAGHWSASTHTDRKPYVDKCDGCGAVVLTRPPTTATGVYGPGDTTPKLVRRTVTDWEEA